MNKAFWLVSIVAIAGCQVSQKVHPWQSPGDPFSVQIDTTDWTLIEPQRVGRVALEYVDEASGWIHVFQGTSNLEIYIPGVRYVPVASPVVILLHDKPKRVLCVAYVGGDRILGLQSMHDGKTW